MFTLSHAEMDELKGTLQTSKVLADRQDKTAHYVYDCDGNCSGTCKNTCQMVCKSTCSALF